MKNGVSNFMYSSIVPNLNCDYDRESEDTIEMYEYKKSDGTVIYMDKSTFTDKVYNMCQQIHADMNELDALIDKMHTMSKDLPKKTFNFETDDLPSIKTNYESLVIVDYYDSLLEKREQVLGKISSFLNQPIGKKHINNNDDSDIIVDFDFKIAKRKEKEKKRLERSKKKQELFERLHGVKTNLVKAAVTVGVVVGLTSSAKEAIDLGPINSNASNISVENDKFINNLTINELVGKTTSSKSKKNYNKVKLNNIQLNNTRLYYTSTYGKPSVSTSNLNHSNYKTHYIAIVNDNGEIIDKFDVFGKNISINKLKKNCRKVYGNKINIMLAVGNSKKGEVIGWTSINSVKKGKSRQKTYVKHI